MQGGKERKGRPTLKGKREGREGGKGGGKYWEPVAWGGLERTKTRGYDRLLCNSQSEALQ